jgi:hypothetical protein
MAASSVPFDFRSLARSGGSRQRRGRLQRKANRTVGGRDPNRRSEDIRVRDKHTAAMLRR